MVNDKYNCVLPRYSAERTKQFSPLCIVLPQIIGYKNLQNGCRIFNSGLFWTVGAAEMNFFFKYLLIKRSVRVVFTICLPQNDEHLWRGRLLCFSGLVRMYAAGL